MKRKLSSKGKIKYMPLVSKTDIEINDIKEIICVCIFILNYKDYIKLKSSFSCVSKINI